MVGTIQIKYRKKYEKGIGSLIKEETRTRIEENTIEDKLQQDFFWALKRQTTH